MSTLAMPIAAQPYRLRRPVEPYVVVLFVLSVTLHVLVWRWLSLAPPAMLSATPEAAAAVEVQLLAPPSAPAVPAVPAQQAAPPPAAVADATASTLPRKMSKPKPRADRSTRTPTEPERSKAESQRAEKTPPAPPAAVRAEASPAAPAAAVPLVKAKHDPAFLHNPKPKYPALANRRNWEGKVVLRVEVTAQGTSAGVAVAQSSGYDVLDESALEAVKAWRFVPARRGDTPVPDTVLITINFHKDDDA